jgi:hypothetical protein
VSQVYPYRLAEFLHSQVDDGLRSVIYYEPEGYEVVFVRDDVDAVADDDMGDLVTDLRADSYEQGIREDLRGHGRLKSTIWVFEEAIEMHFVADECRGVSVALDTETFLAQSTFVSRCLEVAGLE